MNSNSSSSLGHHFRIATAVLLALTMARPPANARSAQPVLPPVPPISGHPIAISGGCQSAFIEVRSAEVTRSKVGFQTFVAESGPPRRFLKRLTTEDAFYYATTNVHNVTGFGSSCLYDYYYTSIPHLANSGTVRFYTDDEWEGALAWEVTLWKSIQTSEQCNSPIGGDTVDGEPGCCDYSFNHFMDGTFEPESGEDNGSSTNALAFWDRPMISLTFMAGTSTNSIANHIITFTPDPMFTFKSELFSVSNCPGAAPVVHDGNLQLDAIATLIESNTPTLRTYTNGASPNGWTPCRQIQQLEQEYTTAMLEEVVLNEALASLPAWGEGIVINACSATTNYNSGVPCASRDLSTNELTLTASISQYRIRIPHSDVDMQYSVTWVTQTTTESGTTVSTNATEVYLGNGGTVYTTPRSFLPPSANGSVCVSGVQIVATPIPGSSGGGCSTGCGGSPGRPQLPGEISSWLDGGPQFRLSLGGTDYGAGAGILRFSGESSSPQLSDPANLKYSGDYSTVEISETDGVLEQIDAPEARATIVPGTHQYEIRLFAPTTSGYSNTAFAICTIQNPNGATNDNELLIIEERESQRTTNAFSYLGTNTWQMIQGNGLRGERLSKQTNGSIVSYLRQVFNPDNGQVLTVTKETYQQFPWGLGLLSKTIDPAGANLFWTNTFNAGGQLLQSVDPDGAWSIYHYDATGRVTTAFSVFGNQTPTTNAALSRKIEYDYDSPAGSPDIATNAPHQARITVEKLKGEIIGKSFSLFPNNQIIVIQATVPTAEWNTSGNLATTNTYIGSGSFARELLKVDKPDGTRESYIYELQSGIKRITTFSGLAENGNPTNVAKGIGTVRTLSVGGSTLSVVATNILTPITISSETSTFDSIGRLVSSTFLDGTSIGRKYDDCCFSMSITNRDGSITTETRDRLKRLIATTHDGITVSNLYDANGNISKVIRIGSDDSMMTNRTMVYDSAGRLIAFTNGGGNGFVVSYTPASSTTLFSDGSSRTESRYLDGTLYQITGSASEPYRRVFYDVGNLHGLQSQAFTEFKLIDGEEAGEWTRTFTDMLGRTVRIQYGDSTHSDPSDTYTFNTLGQLSKFTDADGVTTLYGYVDGQLEYTVIDMNQDGEINPSGTDRITRRVQYYTNDVLGPVLVSATFDWPTNNVDFSVETSRSETSVDGLQTWNTAFGRANRSVTAFAGSGLQVQTHISTDGSFSVTTNLNGSRISVTRYDSAGNPIGGVQFEYDTHGRLSLSTDVRNGTTTNWFDAGDRLIATATPAPGTGAGSQVTTHLYDGGDRIWKTVYPDQTAVTNQHYANGMPWFTAGSRVYPVLYGYDDQRRLTQMRTWKDYRNNSGMAETTWTYNDRGSLATKKYADNSTVTYSYTPGGRLEERAWARGLSSAYSLNKAGEVERITYGGSTGNVTNVYDRLGRVTAVYSGTNITTRLYSDSGLLLSETQDGIVVSNRYDGFQRRTNVAVVIGGTTVASTGYSYDSAGRLLTVTDGTNSATYSYVANSPLVEQIVFKQNGTTRMTTTKSYDLLNRLVAITNLPSDGSPVVFNYAYNSANQRIAITNADGGRWAYTYDSLGQVTSGRKYWSDGARVLGQQFEYTFDDIGNRKTAVSGGDANGRNKRTQTYSANELNQYTSRTVPGYLDIIGEATNIATVTVNSGPTSRKDNYYRAEVSVLNDGAAVWQPITNTAVLASGTNDYVTNWIGHLFVPGTPEVFGYDADGNMTNDGRWSLTWDGENRLIRMESLPNAPVGSSNRLTFAYDAQGRRVSKAVQTFTNGSWTITLSNRFVYDGWNLLAELNATNNAVINFFAWGLDLSGTMQGAGGVGGLLMLSTINSQPSTLFTGFDGNGNVAVLVSATSGTATANYEYDPFGNVLRATGPMALLNPFRFSTKFSDDESGFVYYGYRYDASHIGRWLSRDPIGEIGGLNLYGFVRGNPVSLFDSDGRWVGVDDIFTGPVDEIIVIGALASYLSTLVDWQALGQGIADAADAAWEGAKNLGRNCRPCKYRYPLLKSCGSGFTTTPAEAIQKQVPSYPSLEGPFVLKGSINTGVYQCAKQSGAPTYPGVYISLNVVYRNSAMKWSKPISWSIRCCACCRWFRTSVSCEVLHQSGANKNREPEWPPYPENRPPGLPPYP